MKHALKTALLWCYLLTKRLYKKATFVVILMLIPLVTFGYGMIDTEDSGIITVALAAESEEDPVAERIIGELQADGQLIRYVRHGTSSSAQNAVRMGKCDAAWVFVPQLSQAVRQYGKDPDGKTPLVTVYEREDNVALMLAREQLEGKLYEQYAPHVFLHHVRDNLPAAAGWRDEEVLAYYEKTSMDNEELFEFAQIDIGGLKTDAAQLHYLMTPVRGLLGVVLMLCGLAAAMYYIADSRRGTFSWIPERRRPLAEFGCQAVAVLQVALVSCVSLFFSGVAVAPWREALLTVFGTLCTALFCMLLRRLCRSLRMLGTLLPLLVVITLVVCPVFFDLNTFRLVQYVFPPAYYINAAYNDFWLLMMPVYTAVCAVLYWLFGRLFNRT